MRRAFISAAALMLAATAARAQPAVPLPAAPAAASPAAQRPQVAPPPAWVLPADIPPPPPAAGDAAVVLLLSDTQARLRDGGIEQYSASAFRIGSAQSLQAAAIAVTWDPALESITIHRYRLIRDGKVIDQLGDGTGLTVVRREPNLEQASLDGRLTVTFQPEDVRVGDIVDFAVTQTRRDPALAGRVEAFAGLNAGLPVGRARIRILAPEGVKLRHKAFPGFPEVKPGAKGELLADVRNYTPPRPPRDAPARFLAANFLEVTNAADWAEVSRSAVPLYTAAAAIPAGSQLAAEAARIAAASADPKTRAEAALKLVQENVRYLFLGMNGGGYTPAPATLTWARRFGDCKGKTVLLLGLLRELGIEARPVLVHTDVGDILAVGLPRIGAFNHVLVEARIGGRSYWLDGTRAGDSRIDRLRPPGFAYALPLTAAGADLVALPVPPLERPDARYALELDARDGLTLPAKAAAEFRAEGDAALVWRLGLKQLSPADRDRALREFWRKEHSFITPETVTAAEDPATGAYVLTMKGAGKMDWGTGTPSRYEAEGGNIGFTVDPVREEELGKDAPFAVPYPYWVEHRLTVLLPNGGKDFRADGADIAKSLGPWQFQRTTKLAGDRLTLTSSVRSTAPEMAAAVARAEEPAFRALSKTAVWVGAPVRYAYTPVEVKSFKSGGLLATASEYIDRAIRLNDAGEREAGTRDIEAALKLEPSNAEALGKLAIYYASIDPDRSSKLAEAALARNPAQNNALAARAVLAANAGRFDEADRNWTATLTAAPGWDYALAGRASSRMKAGRTDDALADVASLEKLGYDKQRVNGARTEVLMAGGRTKEALALYDQLVSQSPKDVRVRYGRAYLRRQLGDKPGARADFDAIIALEPSFGPLIDRAQTWDAGQQREWRADIARARTLAPKEARVPLTLAAMEVRLKNWDAAVKAADEALRLAPADPEIASTRLQVLRQAKRIEPAAEIAELERLANLQPASAAMLNNLCWARATLNRELTRALANCDAAVKLAPASAPALDSRALVHLRLKDYDRSIADYDAALKLQPDQSVSLYGRGLARLARGDKAGAAADLAAARKLNPKVDEEFRTYGIPAPDTPPAKVAATAS